MVQVRHFDVGDESIAITVPEIHADLERYPSQVGFAVQMEPPADAVHEFLDRGLVFGIALLPGQVHGVGQLHQSDGVQRHFAAQSHLTAVGYVVIP